MKKERDLENKIDALISAISQLVKMLRTEEDYDIEDFTTGLELKEIERIETMLSNNRRLN